MALEISSAAFSSPLSEVGKVTLKSNSDEALSDESLKKK
jgi:hypothetical protein